MLGRKTGDSGDDVTQGHGAAAAGAPEQAAADGGAASTVATPPKQGFWAGWEDQFGITSLLTTFVRNYMVPVETNSIWYVLGGVLAIAIGLEFLTGVILVFAYHPNAAQAYQSTVAMLDSRGWSIILNFHYYNSYVIFVLVMVHLLRVFISSAYGGTKKGLWLVGTGLAAVVFSISITGETLHWDERGFAVPWHIGEFLEAIRLQGFFNWAHKALLNVNFASDKLLIIYVVHIVLLPALLATLMFLHYYLIKQKHISLPFWRRPTGRETAFGEHMRGWFIYGGIIFAIILIISIVITRDAGPAPQNLAISPFYHAKEGPGGLGITPTWPISWTHGMNRFVSICCNFEPDIWGTVIGMVVMLGALIAIPFVDRSTHEPRSWTEAFDLRRRGVVFGLLALFWVTLIVGTVTNAVTPVG
jgi:ubiquinol-cytochrome c reductase cytochrome b subunit